MKNQPPPKNILIVDDEASIRISFRLYLEDCGYQVCEAKNGIEGLQIFKQVKPNLVLVDLRMPGMDGLSVLENIARQAPDTPVIVISGVGKINNAVQALRMGAWDYITKPVEDLSFLNHSIEKALERCDFIIQSKQYKEHLEKEVSVRTLELKQKAKELEKKNIDLENAQAMIQEKMKALEMSNQYKTEFLANMSHELRTPLNSILLLSKLLMENRQQNLGQKQLEFLSTINASGTSLLEMINDILDLSKIEAGKMELWISKIKLMDLANKIKRQFTPFATEKGISFKTVLGKNLPDTIHTDAKRLDQILKNLLSNACKFTDSGEVVFSIEKPDHLPASDQLQSASEETIAFSVADTGIGISPAKRSLIFEAFRQADGSINRKYGGTGLGLSISRKLSRALGGELLYIDKTGKGSTFTLFLPEKARQDKNIFAAGAENPRQEDAAAFHGGSAKKISRDKNPDSADSRSTVSDPENFIRDDRRMLNPEKQTVLIVEPDMQLAEELKSLFQKNNYNVIITESGEGSLHLSDYYLPDVIMLCSELPGMKPEKVIRILKSSRRTERIPVVCLQSDSTAEHSAVIQGAYGCIPLADLQSSAPHIIAMAGNATTNNPIDRVQIQADESGSTIFENNKILIVDKDMRSVYAILNVLQEYKMQTVVGRSLEECMNHLKGNPDISLLIMEILLDEKEGYESLREIRKDPTYRNLPIIILTTKAVRGERNKCIQYGANEWLAKPVEIDKLISMIRVWIQIKNQAGETLAM